MSFLQKITLYPYPSNVWDISPPALSTFRQLLELAANQTAIDEERPAVVASLVYSFTRPGPLSLETVTGTSSRVLTAEQCAQIVDAVNAAQTNAIAPGRDVATIMSQSDSAIGSPIAIPYMYPIMSRLTSKTDKKPINLLPRTSSWQWIDLQLYRGQNSSSNLIWWTMTMHNSTQQDTGLVFLAASDKIAPDILTSSLGSISVVAVYITVVYTVGRLVRAGLGAPTHRIIYEEMPEVSDLLELCEVCALVLASHEFTLCCLFRASTSHDTSSDCTMRCTCIKYLSN